MQKLAQLKNNKPLLLVLAAVALIVFEFATDTFGVKTFSLDQFAAEPEAVADIRDLSQDVRLNPGESEEWFAAEKESEILLGDTLYTGRNSTAAVEMRSGGGLDLGEETLVVFDSKDGVLVPDIEKGLVRLRLNGTLRIALSGQMTEFSGAESEVVVALTEGKDLKQKTVTYKVLKGFASVFSFFKGEKRQDQTLRAGESKQSKLTLSEPRKLAPPLAPVKSLSELRRPNPSQPKPEQQSAKSAAQSGIADLRSIKTELVSQGLIPSGPDSDANQNGIATEPIRSTPQADQSVPTPPMVESKAEPVTDQVMSQLKLPKPISPQSSVVRYLKVSDLYERKTKNRLVKRKAPPEIIQEPVLLKWTTEQSVNPQMVYVQISETADFKGPVQKLKSDRGFVVQRSWPKSGAFWRLSSNGQSWTEPVAFQFESRLTDQQQALLSVDSKSLFISKKNPIAKAELKFVEKKLKSGLAGWVLEATTDTDFESAKTRVLSFTTDQVQKPLKIPFSKTGTYRFRIRSVAKSGTVSAPSGAAVITVENGDLKRKETYELKRLAEMKKKNEAEETRRLKERLEAEKQRQELARLDNEFDDAARSKRKTKRNVASQISSEFDAGTEAGLGPQKWFVGLEGSQMAAVSSDLVADGAQPASVQTVAIHVGYRRGSQVTRAYYRSQFAASNPAGRGQSITRIEGRHDYWFGSKLSLFKIPIRYGLVGAFFNHRNSGTAELSPGYSVLKGGGTVRFDLTENWSTGGDVLVGAWFDSSRYAELNGFLGYDLTNALNFSVGYRLNVFEAGSAGLTPFGLPYREAFAEAYSALNFGF